MANLPYEVHRDDWTFVLPDGPAFNHWGGKSISDRLIALLELTSSHSVLDVCCGEGGTLGELPNVRYKCGLDISAPALKRCEDRNTNATFVNADAHQIPFDDEMFDRVLSQDADAWLQGDAVTVLREISRVLKPGGIFVFQNYVQSSAMPVEAVAKTRLILQSSGFTHTDLLIKEDLEECFCAAGLVIKKIIDVHDVYSYDNARMLVAALSQSEQSPLLPLLEWESRLFREKWWTGVIIVASPA